MIVFVISVLALFFGASILYQHKPMSGYLIKFDPLNVLPRYTFFAPNPMTNDFRLVYKVKDQFESEWEEISIYQPFTLYRIAWNPFKYYNKGMIDLCQFLIQEYADVKDKDKIKASENHVNIVLSIYRYLKYKGDNCTALKFAVVKSGGYNSLRINEIVFSSDLQKI